MKKIYKRNCPSCGKELFYADNSSLCHSEKFNRKCHVSCGKVRYIIDKNGCWNFQGSISRTGYGMAKKKGIKATTAHRIAYIEKYGELDDNIQLDHLCRNRKCCNPDHLEPVTREVNVQRGNSTKLKTEEVLEIRKIGSSINQRKVAKIYNVSQTLIWRILHKLVWKNI